MAPAAPSRPCRARLWVGPLGHSAVCDWFLGTMLRLRAGPGAAAGALPAPFSPSSEDWGRAAPAASVSLSRLTPGRPAKSRGPQRWCKVNFNYSPEQADELKLQAGEIVEVIKEVRRRSDERLWVE